ncbi:MAG: type II/IV secretion system protein [Deltaproteobacteria bacterium]|nr:type II/IV secretion system protein [Deltaproteobacteria bacterium]
MKLTFTTPSSAVEPAPSPDRAGVAATRPSSPALPQAAGAARSVPASRAAQAVELLRSRRLSPQQLTAAGFKSAEELLDILAQQFRLARLDLDALDIAPDIANLVPRSLAERHRIVPLFATDGELSLATSDPTQIEVFDWLSREVRRSVTIVLALPSEIDRALRRLYEPRPAIQLDIDVDDISQEAIAEATPIVNGIITSAVQQHASDIHIEVTDEMMVVRFRVDGALRVVDQRSRELHPAVVSRIKVLARCDISIRHAPQDGRIKLRTSLGDVDLRVSVLPTYWGEKVVCRILDNTKAALPLDAIGFESAERTTFERMIRSPYGLVLVTGPTGSGKSTTLYAALNTVRSPDTNIVTVEDPVEYQLPGINQVHVNPKRGLTFATALRSILRQDPDIILVGEIRDHETGMIAAEAALTGHLVLASLHTNDAISAVTRLTEMGIEPYLLAPSLVGVVAQRLVRRICPDCSERYIPADEELAAIGVPSLPSGIELARGRGCESCHRTGYKGRVAVREVLEIDESTRALITRHCTTSDLKAHVTKRGWRGMRFSALRLLFARQTTTREVLRMTKGA